MDYLTTCWKAAFILTVSSGSICSAFSHPVKICSEVEENVRDLSLHNILSPVRATENALGNVRSRICIAQCYAFCILFRWRINAPNLRFACRSAYTLLVRIRHLVRAIEGKRTARSVNTLSSFSLEPSVQANPWSGKSSMNHAPLCIWTNFILSFLCRYVVVLYFRWRIYRFNKY